MRSSLCIYKIKREGGLFYFKKERKEIRGRVCVVWTCVTLAVILLTERIIVFLYLYANKFLVHTYPQIQYRASTLHYQSVSPLHLSLSYIFLLLVSPVTHQSFQYQLKHIVYE